MRRERKNNLILIADDDLLVRKIIQKGLEGLSDFIEVTDGAKVVETYKKNLPDMVYLDINLPNYSGIKCLKEILFFDPQAYIVMVSANSTEENVTHTIDLGIKGFLTKPFSKTRLQYYFNQCPTIPITVKTTNSAD